MIKELGKICYFENKFKKTEIIIKNVISSNFGKIFLKISTFDAKIKIDFRNSQEDVLSNIYSVPKFLYSFVSICVFMSEASM